MNGLKLIETCKQLLAEGLSDEAIYTRLIILDMQDKNKVMKKKGLNNG